MKGVTRLGNPRPYDLQPIEGAKDSADGRCAGCGARAVLPTMTRDANRGVFAGLYCEDCTAHQRETGRATR